MAPRADPRVVHAVLAYQGAQTVLRARLAQTVTHSWVSLGSYHKPDIAKFAARTAPVVLGGQKAMSALTVAYLARVRAVAKPGSRPVTVKAATVTGPDLRGGLDPVAEYTRPGETVWYQLSIGTELAVAIGLGLDRALQLAATDLQLAKTWTSQAVMRADGVALYERVPDGTACDYCLGAAQDGPYRSDNLMPIHTHCGCDVAPIYTDTAAQVPTTALDPGADTAPELDPYAVEDNGEIGPVLVGAGQNFRDATDVAADENT